jgi:hypothetical protein
LSPDQPTVAASAIWHAAKLSNLGVVPDESTQGRVTRSIRRGGGIFEGLGHGTDL